MKKLAIIIFILTSIIACKPAVESKSNKRYDKRSIFIRVFDRGENIYTDSGLCELEIIKQAKEPYREFIVITKHLNDDSVRVTKILLNESMTYWISEN